MGIRAVNEGQMGCLKRSKDYGIPKITLRRRVQEKNVYATGSKKGLGRFLSTFSKDQKNVLVTHVLDLEWKFFLSYMETSSTTCIRIGRKKSYLTELQREKRLAGVNWTSGFLQRRSQLSICTPKLTSAALAKGFARGSVRKLFALRGEVIVECNRIFVLSQP